MDMVVADTGRMVEGSNTNPKQSEQLQRSKYHSTYQLPSKLEMATKHCFGRIGLTDELLCNQYAELYNITHTRGTTVAEFHDDGTWMIPLPVHATAEMRDQHTRSLNQLADIRLHRQIRDIIKWERSNIGYTVNSYYKFVNNAPTMETGFRHIWELKGPPRVLIFTWLMLENAILTTDNLIKRGWQMPSICHMCHQIRRRCDTYSHIAR